MNTFNCMNPTETHYGGWIKPKENAQKAPEDIVEKFKRDPGSFFAPMTPPAKKPQSK